MIEYTPLLPKELAAVTLVISVMIIATNILVFLTFCRMNKLSLQQLHMFALVGPDLVMFIVNSVSAGITINGGFSLDTHQCQLLGVITQTH